MGQLCSTELEFKLDGCKTETTAGSGFPVSEIESRGVEFEEFCREETVPAVVAVFKNDDDP